MHGNFPARRDAPANANQVIESERRDPRAARDVAPGEPWMFVEHRTLAEVIAAFRRGAPRRKASPGARRRSSVREHEETAPARFKFGTAAIKRDAAKRLRSLKRS